ncbi:MAG: YceD family protein [Solirubrobacteraceae bacterium]
MRIAPLALGGEQYVGKPDVVPAVVDVSRTTGGGYALRLRFQAMLSGPCMRCLEAAEPSFDVDAREFWQPGGDDELSSPYLENEVLDLEAWARDALALALPAVLVCRQDCAGLCPVCGVRLDGAGPDHVHERSSDPRWAKLKELRFD